MTRALTVITADLLLAKRRGIKVVIIGKSGIGKTSLLRTLPQDMTLFFDLDDGSPETEVRS